MFYALPHPSRYRRAAQDHRARAEHGADYLADADQLGAAVRDCLDSAGLGLFDEHTVRAVYVGAWAAAMVLGRENPVMATRLMWVTALLLEEGIRQGVDATDMGW